MDPLIFLAHRIPFPPNKGDKIRSFHLLRHLSRRYRIFLGAFVDDPEDWAYRDELKQWCDEIFLLPLHPLRQRIRSLTALLTGAALSQAYFHQHKMARWVDRKLRQHDIRDAFIYSSPMAQYVLGREHAELHRILDMVDVDSEKWRQYSTRHAWPMNWIYRREAERLLAFERRAAAICDRTLLVSAQEAACFVTRAPECAARVEALPNGVDTDYFRPDPGLPKPYPEQDQVLVFTGAMDYWANVDAVCWFAGEVFPSIRARHPHARFVIAGSNPTEAVRLLAERDGITVTGRVEDMRPYLQHAVAAVAPLRVARGLQNKVLEAMAMDKTVIATPAAMEGIDIDAELAQFVAEDPAGLARLAGTVIEADPLKAQPGAGRDFVLARHAWAPQLQRLDEAMKHG